MLTGLTNQRFSILNSVKSVFSSFSGKKWQKFSILQQADYQSVAKYTVFGKNFFN